MAGRQSAKPANTIQQCPCETEARAAAVAKLVTQRRTELGLTQKELAERAGTSYSQVSRIESGRHSVTNETFDKVFVALGARPIHGYEVPARPGHAARRELVAV